MFFSEIFRLKYPRNITNKYKYEHFSYSFTIRVNVKWNRSRALKLYMLGSVSQKLKNLMDWLWPGHLRPAFIRICFLVLGLFRHLYQQYLQFIRHLRHRWLFLNTFSNILLPWILSVICTDLSRSVGLGLYILYTDLACISGWGIY